MNQVNPYSTLQDILQSLCDGINNMQSNSGGMPIDQYQLFQKLDELRSTIDNMGGHVGAIANNGQLIEGHLETISSAIVKILEGDEDRLMERLKAKVKANYSEQRDVLVQFCNWIDTEKEEALPTHPSELVDKFLEEVGDE